MNQNFKIPSRLNLICLILMAVGAVLFAIGWFTTIGEDHGASRLWAALLYNNFLFLGIALIGLFFAAVHEIGYGGWLISLKRVLEAVASYIPIGGILMLVILVLGGHDLYHHWDNDALYVVDGPEYDALVAQKRSYLNMPFFLIRAVIYVVLWVVFYLWFRRNSLKLDAAGDNRVPVYKRSKMISALFLFFFAITSSTAAWDWFMSIDPHWYSTLYGWYTFASIFVSGLCAVVIIIYMLKRMGYLEAVNEEHMHDLGKFIFGFSVFWTYLWFSQFLLIWYANISEETLYFKTRFEGGYKFVFFLAMFINFVVPFFVLLTRGAKRALGTLVFMSVLLILGHWLDFYVMTHPGVVGTGAEFSLFIEFALLIFYVGLFGFVVFRSLSKAPLYQLNHPFMKESLIHHT